MACSIHAEQRTSPSPFSAHHSARVVRRISPRTRKSNGTGFSNDRDLFTSCDSWYRRHEPGIMNFWEGRGYADWVVNTTGWATSDCDVDAI